MFRPPTGSVFPWGKMNPPMQEKSNKKVSRACNTCRLKRKKCDGLDPCFFCTENKLECSYSREPRRRGPPSGYLRYTETRVALLETLLGLYVFKNSGNTSDPFLDAANTLLLESKTCTQDIWDAYKSSWTVSASAKVVEDLAMFFAPFHRAEHEQASKPLLPIATNGVKPKPLFFPSPPTSTTTNPLVWPHPHRPDTPTHPRRNSVTYHVHQPRIISRESFERTQNASASFSSPIAEQVRESSGSQSWSSNLPHHDLSDIGFEFPGESSKLASSQMLYPSASSILQHDYSHDSTQILGDVDNSMMGIEPENNPDSLLTTVQKESDAYTGSYWRTAELTQSDLCGSPKTGFFTTPMTSGIELPPPHILSNLIDVYYRHVYPSFPFLPPRSSLEPQIKGSSASTNPEGLNTMLLALCAYSGRMSPSLDSATSGVWGGTGEAGKVAADLWYEQSRTAVGAGIRKGSSVETVQTLLLLALRDHGRGYESQAWLLVGLAVRMGQDLDLNEDGTNPPPNRPELSPEDQQTRRNIWGVSLMLDLFLSLQLGRPPAIVDALRAPSASNTDKWKTDILNASLVPGIVPPPQPLFTHTITLCQIISRINFHLYLGFSSEVRPQTEKLLTLKTELDMWQHGLPHEYRISIGHQPERDVLEVNMLYHVAIILLYRPFSKDKAVQQAADVFLEAASTFNVLLEKYQHSQSPTLSPSSHLARPSLTLSNPNMIYLIFTVSIAHLSGFKLRQSQQAHSNHTGHSRSTTMALQTQLHLLNCLEALTSIGGTWELARRCWRTLDKLMDMEGMKPRPVSSNSSRVQETVEGVGLGKRKRDGEDQAGRSDGPVQLSPTGNHLRDAREGAMVSPSTSHRSDVMAFTQGGWNQNQSLMELNSGLSNDPSNALPPTSMSASAGIDIFDQNIFASARWLPEVLNTPEAVPVGLGMVWDGEWDDGFWAQSLNLGLTEGG